ncbi:MAG: CPBP family intramembrane metalloprotease [Alphaproteobacteria bacterium]|nr:CPBP family intramembrane metalloprotease [Alphaproteobacteria bacterium]
MTTPFAALPQRIAASLATFLVLGCALSWYPWVLHLMGRPGNGGPNPLGLLLAALIAVAVAGGWRGSVEVLRSIVRVRAPLAAWATALFLPLILIGLPLAIASRIGIAVTPAPPNWSDLLDKFLIMFLFVGLGEEPAWRGFLLPLLQRRYTPLVATLIVAAIWAVWHLPLMGTEFAWPRVPMFLISLLGAAFIQSWLYNASNASSLLPMTMHAILNTAGSGYAFMLIGPTDLSRFWWIYAAFWLTTGLAFVILTRGRLGKGAIRA